MILDIGYGSWSPVAGARCQGSANVRYLSLSANYLGTGFIVGVDTNRHVSLYLDSQLGTFYVVGYLTKGKFKVNSADYDTALNAWYENNFSGDADYSSNYGGVVCHLYYNSQEGLGA